MSEGVFIRMNKKEKEKAEQDRKLKGIETQNEYGIQAYRHFRECHKSAAKFKGMKEMPAPINYECGICHKKGKKGESVMYEAGEMICVECYVARRGDEQTAKLEMRKAELKFDNKALENEKERRIQELMEIQYVTLIKDAYEQDRKILQHDVERNQRNTEMMQLNEKCIKEVIDKLGEKEGKELLEKLSQLYEVQISDREDRLKEREDLRAKMDRANEIYKKFMLPRKKGKKVKEISV